jgi:hypothetical protein
MSIVEKVEEENPTKDRAENLLWDLISERVQVNCMYDNLIRELKKEVN